MTVTIDPTTLLAELAAIQRDVRVLADCHVIVMPNTEAWCKDLCTRIGLLMSSIAAPPPVSAAAEAMVSQLMAALDESRAAADMLIRSLPVRARAAFAAGYAAACTGGMSGADQRRLRERMTRWLEVQRG